MVLPFNDVFFTSSTQPDGLFLLPLSPNSTPTIIRGFTETLTLFLASIVPVGQDSRHDSRATYYSNL